MFLDSARVDLQCPRCGYIVETTILDIRLQTHCWCECCRCRIQLREVDVSVTEATIEVDSALDRLANTMRRISR